MSKAVNKGYEQMRNPLLESNHSLATTKDWKPAINISYETLVLA